MILRPLQRLRAAWRDSARPAPWHAEENAFILGSRLAHQNVRARPHAAANEHRLTDRTKHRGQAFVAGPEGAGGAFSVGEQLSPSALNRVCLDLAGVVRDIEQELQLAIWKEVREYAPRIVAKDLAVGERAIDRGAHGAEVSLANFGIDRRAGELAIGKRDT